MTEKELQRSAEVYLKNRDIIYIHLENNQHYQKYRKPASNKYKGIPDLIIFLPEDTTIFIELKTPTGKLKPEQIRVMGRLESLGYEYHIITNIDDFIQTIERLY